MNRTGIAAPRTAARPLWKRWAIGSASVLCAATIVGGAAFSASASTVNSPSSASSTVSRHHASPKAKAAHKPGRELRAELHTVIRNGKNAGDLAAAMAVIILDTHTKFDAKLPVALQSDLRTLADAPVTQRTADAARIKAAAIGGTYGTKIQTEAKNIQTNLARHPQK